MYGLEHTILMTILMRIVNSDPLAAFPTKFIASTQHKDVHYYRQTHLFAVHGPVPRALQAQVNQILGDGKVSLCRGEVPRVPELDLLSKLSPVYSLGPGSPPAIPTGRVFIRFTEQVAAQDRQGDLARLGYRIVRVTPYTRHTAWLDSVSGTIAEALAGLPDLEQLPDVANVEPEMLKPMARKT
jgi:hypothetical protein